jgi:hypothetical protein
MRASNLARKLIALNFSQKVFNFRKIYTPKFLGCYTGGPPPPEPPLPPLFLCEPGEEDDHLAKTPLPFPLFLTKPLPYSLSLPFTPK